MKTLRSLACLAPILLAACGADPAPGPVEQIIVREAGAKTAAPAPAAATGDAAGALIAEGKAAFANCSACHAVAKDAPNGAGPNLFAIVDQPAGQVAGFAYSDALKASGITWTAAELDGFIADPSAKIPGTTMVTGAIADAATRQAVIAYLESITAN
jgi:cytochrome c